MIYLVFIYSDIYWVHTMCQTQEEVLWINTQPVPTGPKESPCDGESLSPPGPGASCYSHICVHQGPLSGSDLLLIPWIPYQNPLREGSAFVKFPLRIICKTFALTKLARGGCLRLFSLAKTCISSFNLDWMYNEKRMVRCRNADRHQQWMRLQHLLKINELPEFYL